MEVVDKIWLPPRDSNPDMLIQSCCLSFSSSIQLSSPALTNHHTFSNIEAAEVTRDRF